MTGSLNLKPHSTRAPGTSNISNASDVANNTGPNSSELSSTTTASANPSDAARPRARALQGHDKAVIYSNGVRLCTFPACRSCQIKIVRFRGWWTRFRVQGFEACLPARTVSLAHVPYTVFKLCRSCGPLLRTADAKGSNKDPSMAPLNPKLWYHLRAAGPSSLKPTSEIRVALWS